MLHLLDDALRSFLAEAVPLASGEVEIAFEAPDGDWAAGVAQPTVDLYLWQVLPNLDQAEFGFVDTRLGDGRVRRRTPLPRVDCHYLVTAWTTEIADEHALLGRVLVALLGNPVLPPRYLGGALAGLQPPPSLTLSAGSGANVPDFWSALGGQLKPALDLVVTLTVDAALLREAGPAVESVVLRQSTIGGQPGPDVHLHPRPPDPDPADPDDVDAAPG